jgi:hypothetical protein
MRTFKKFLPLMLILSVLFLSNQAKAASISGTYYVSTTGSDSNSGSLLSPWRTMQHGLDVAQAGDTILVRGGVYSESLTFTRSGAEGAPITLSGYPGEKATLDGTGLSPVRTAVNLTSQDYITIANLTICNYSRDGLYSGFGVVVWDDGDYITLRGLEFHHVGIPIKIAANGGTDVRSKITIENINAHDYPGGGIDIGPGTVEDVVIRNVQMNGVTSGNDTGSDGIAVEHGNRILVEDVIVRGHMGDGVDLKADNATVRRADIRNHARNGIKLWGANELVENCWVSGSRSGYGTLILPGAGPYVVRNSVFVGTGGENGTVNSYTVELGRYGAAATEPAAYATLYNNVIHADNNQGVLINVAANVRVKAESDYNVYYSPRPSAVLGANNESGLNMFPITSDDINNSRYAQFISGEAHSKFDATVPSAVPSAPTAPAPSATPVPTPALVVVAPTPAPTPVATTTPTIFLASGSANTGAILNASTGKFGKLSIITPEALGSDKRTRLMLFATGISTGTASSPLSVNEVSTNNVVLTNLTDTVTVEARTSSGQVFQLPVEFAGAQNTGSTLDQVDVVLISELQGAGNVQLTLIRNGLRSNSATVTVQ